ncbi:hypothetical protein EYF80_007425 [Liparis tanakae]|uniref:Uncharacterized protein n=1 Tax=Liparis tanakae TaxID=230148 RepID=A0A4Z2IXP4_9TELE|nr:hypothetical protein EYF80_007425 [Liparis tanakae]
MWNDPCVSEPDCTCPSGSDQKPPAGPLQAQLLHFKEMTPITSNALFQMRRRPGTWYLGLRGGRRQLGTSQLAACVARLC